MKNVSKKTIIRTVLMLVALVNLILNLTGKKTLPFTDDEISMGVAAVLDAIATIWVWWKNNSFTAEAITADEYLASLKDETDRGGGTSDKTNLGLVEYCKKQLGKPYWYGTFGLISSVALYKSKKKQYPKQYQWACPSNQLNKRVHDCIGLIKGYLWSKSPDSVPVYNGSQDVSANGMRSLCKKGGSISTMPDVKGVLVFSEGHVGVYIGGGKVIEARGHNYGVVETELKKRGWTHWGYCPWITYIKDEEPKKTVTKTTTTTKKKTVDEIAKEVVAGKWGVGDERKKKLTAAGYDYNTVQKRVNELVSAMTKTSAKKSVTTIAKEVIEGKWGNGEERKKKLTAAGYDYKAVQKEVKKLL